MDATVLPDDLRRLDTELEVHTRCLTRGASQNGIQHAAADVVPVKTLVRRTDPAVPGPQVDGVRNRTGCLQLWHESEPFEDPGGAGLDEVGARALVVAGVAVLLEHRYPKALPSEEDRRCGAAEAATDDDDIGCLWHVDLSFLSAARAPSCRAGMTFDR